MSQRTGLLKLTLLGVLFAACGARGEAPPGAQANADVRADATPRESRMADEVEIVMLGKATFEGGRLTLGERWLTGEGESGIKPGMGFDVLNCAGFVARARVVGPAGASREEQYGWRVEVVPESVRADAAAAQGRCAGGGGGGRVGGAGPRPGSRISRSARLRRSSREPRPLSIRSMPSCGARTSTRDSPR